VPWNVPIDEANRVVIPLCFRVGHEEGVGDDDDCHDDIDGS